MSKLYLTHGPPGCGKTYELARLCERAADKHGASNVAIASLTRTAAHEIAGRVDLPEGMAATLHAHAYRALDMPDLAETPEGIRAFNQACPAHRLTGGARGLDDLDEAGAVDDDADGTTDADRLHAQVMANRARMLPRSEWTDAQLDHDAVWEDFKRQTDRADFTDLIERCIVEVGEHPAAPAVWLFDEAQDFSALELALAVRWVDAPSVQTAVVVGDVDQCQPGDVIVETTNGPKALEDLDPETDRLVSFDRRDKRIYGYRNGGFAFTKAERPYEGDLLHVRSNGRETRCTPDHRWPVKWVGPRDACAVYLMRQGDHWRVGWCQIHSTAGGGFHLGVRARLEKADAAWILGVHHDRQDASVAESIVAAQYGLPTITFEPRPGARGHCTREAIDAVYAALNPVEQRERALACLHAHGRHVDHPLWSAAEHHAKQGRRTSWTVRACNLIPGLMAIASARGSYADWHPIEMVTRLPWRGTVCSLEVKPHETYVADGLVTHNCLYSFRGSEPANLLGLERAGERVLEQSYRVPRAVHAAATAWIGQIEDRRAIAYRPTDHDGRVEAHPGALVAPETWLDELQADLETGTVMVLATCGYMLSPLLKVLRRHGIPYHNPYRPDRGQWNPMRGARRLRSFLRPDHRQWGDKARSWTWGDLHDWTEPLRARDALTRGAKALIEAKVTADRFGESMAMQEVPFDTLRELLGTTDLHHPALRLDVDWWEHHLLASKAKSAEYPLAVLRRRGHEALRETPRLTVGTVHSVKGGEASTVYVAPDLSAAAMGAWEERGPGRDQIVRAGYVALTRARDTVRLLAPSGPCRMPLWTCVEQPEAVGA